LRHASILDVDESWGQFDYVICHGVYSWVPEAVQDKILTICKANLTPNGVAYVSYNTLPGWHMRGMIRDMMRYHSNRFAEAEPCRSSRPAPCWTSWSRPSATRPTTRTPRS